MYSQHSMNHPHGPYLNEKASLLKDIQAHKAKLAGKTTHTTYNKQKFYVLSALEFFMQGRATFNSVKLAIQSCPRYDAGIFSETSFLYSKVVDFYINYKALHDSYFGQK